MSIFDANELRFLLSETKATLLSEGNDKKTAERLTRREYIKWLEGFRAELKLTIASNATLEPKNRDKRVKRAGEDFHYFRTTYFPHYYYLPGKSLLQEELETIYLRIAKKSKLSAAAAASAAGVRFALAAPRGHGKSTDVSVVFIIWCIVYRLKHFITLFSDAIELAETLVESIKAELEENENLKADFPLATGMGRIWRVGEIVSANGIKVKAYGSGKRVRGVKHGVWRVDLSVIDDLENDENVRSQDQRDKLENWLDEAIEYLGSLNDTMDILYIGTLLHRDAVLARKLKHAYWNPKIFRAVMRFPERMDLWEEYTNLYKHQGEAQAHAFYLSNQPDMDEGSRVLWKEAVPIETLMRKRARSKRAFDKELQNNPGAEDQSFKRESMHFYSEVPRRKIEYYGYCDPSLGKKKSDYANFTILAVSRELRRAWVAESINQRLPSKEIVKKIVDLQEEYHCKLFGYETNGGQGHLVPFIKDAAFDRGVHMPLKEINSTEAKEARIAEIEIPVESGEIMLHETQLVLISQLEEFPEGKNDDAPDGLAGCYRLTKLGKRRKGGSKRKQKPKPKRSINYGRLP